MPRDLRQPDRNEQDRPSSWQHAPGSEIIGTLVRYEKAQTKNGEKIVAHIRPDEGGPVVAVWLSATVLMSEFKKHRPRPGERLSVKRHADHPTKGYQVWSVLVDRPEVPSIEVPL